MKFLKSNILIVSSVFGIFALFFSCNQSEKPIETPVEAEKPFTIAATFRDSIKAEELSQKLHKLISDTIISKVLTNEKGRKRYRVETGYFYTLEDACKKGLEMVSDSLFEDFDIYEDGNLSNNYLRNLFFIGKYLDRPGLYKYDLIKKRKSMVWSPWGRKIISYEQSEDMVNAFFVTVFRIGNTVSFPYMQKVKIYHFNREEETVNSVEFLGKNQRIQTEWVSDDTFRVIVTSLDSFSTVNIYKKTMKYLENGTRVYFDSLKYNLLNEGYPAFPKAEIEYSSPDRQFKVIAVNDSSGKKYELFNLISASTSDLEGVNGDIKEIQWDNSLKYIFLSTSQTDSVSDSTYIHIFDYTTGNKIITLSRMGNNTFSCFGNLFFYDYGKGQEREIKVYDLKNRRPYGDIRVNGGCGLKNIDILNLKSTQNR